MLSFLEVPDSVRPMLSRGATKQVDYKDVDGESKDSIADKMSYGAKTSEERKVLELVQVLKSHPNKVAALQSFEDYFFSERPRLSSETIRILFEGLPGESSGGLINTCGDFRHSRVASRAALCLLDRLLDSEKNKDAPAFVEQICSLSASVLQKMKLHVHILSARGNRVHAFKAIHVICQYLEANKGLNSMGYPGELSLETLVQDFTARQDYQRWVSCREAHHTASAAIQNVVSVDKLAARDGNHKALATNGFLDVLQLAEREDGWRDIWNINNTQSQGVHLSYRKDADKDLTCLRASVIVNATPDQVTTALTDVADMPSWDVKLRSASVVHKLDEATDVIHLVYKSFASYYKCKDFSLLRSISRLDDGGVLLMFRSVQSSRCPEIRECTRSSMRPSGYIVTPINTPALPASIAGVVSETPEDEESDACCMVTFLLQLDRDSVLLVSQDLLGESDDIIRTMLNLNTVLQTRRCEQRL